MNPVYEKLQKCYESYKAKIDFTPKVALVLGSGLGDYADDIRVVDTLDYHDIEGFPVSTVPGHKGRFIFGYVGEVPVVCMQGRVPDDDDGRRGIIPHQCGRRYPAWHERR